MQDSSDFRFPRSQGSSSLQVLLHPPEHGLVPALAVKRAEDPVSFIRENQSFGRDSIPPQRGEQLKTLIDRHAKILLVRDHESGRLDIRSSEMRRAPCKVALRCGAGGRSAGFP